MLGPSGCGKTTTPWLMAGLEQPDDDGGEVRLLGEVGVDAFLHGPILVLVAFWFNDSTLSAGWVGFTLDWYYRLLERPDILRGLKASVIVGGASIAISSVLGTLVALAQYRYWGRTYGMFRGNIEPSINAISTIILLVTTALIHLAERLVWEP